MLCTYVRKHNRKFTIKIYDFQPHRYSTRRDMNWNEIWKYENARALNNNIPTSF